VTEANDAPTRTARRPPLAMLSLLALPLFVLVGVGTGVGLGVRGGDVQVLALALVTAAVAFVPLILDFGRPPAQRHLLLFVFLISYLVFFVFSVFTTYFFADTFLGRSEYDALELKGIRPTDIAWGQTAVLVGLLALLAGYAIPLGRLVPGGIPRPQRDWSFQSTLVVALIAILTVWVIYLSAQFGILPKRVGSGLLGALSSSTFFGIALLMLSYLRYRSQGALALLALLIPPTMAFNYFTGSKGAFFSAIGVTMIAYLVVKRRIRFRWILAVFVAFSLFYPIAEFQRQVILQGNRRSTIWALQRLPEVVSQTSRFVSGQKFGEYFVRGAASTLSRFDGLGVTSVILRDCPARVPFQGGWSIAHIFITYVPRILWKGKPELSSGQWVTTNFGPGADVISATGPTWIGELWFNFGWRGVVTGMFLMGVYFRILHEMLFKQGAVIPAQLMSVIVLLAIPPSLGGVLMAPINGVIITALPLALAHWSVRLMSGTLRPATASDGRSADLVTEARAEI